jgi:dipeptidyl aminopeptidase/acylaminoacyl peptidase
MFAASYEALDGKVFAKKEKYDYTTSDGLLVPGYLTVPAGASRQSMPLIVLPHGGPWARDDQTFDWWPFFYAARGYLVYQPNFRGSDGYGLDFRAAGDGEWGRRMQDDITEGVKKLIADGIADPSRICIVGGSYGGYAALAGATMTPDLYACSVSVNGVADLAAMIGRSARWSEEAEDYWDRRIGSRFRDREAIDQASPAKIADRAGAPILLIHGKDDTVVPISQSILMRDALKAAGKPFEYVELDGEDHWLSSGKMRTEMLARSIEFIDRHIGAATVAAAP